jgi:hypothetical protein
MSKKQIELPNKVLWDGGAGRKGELTAPSLIALFWSERLQGHFDKDPKRTYSIQELIELMDAPCSASALRDHIKLNVELFDTEKKVRKTQKGLVIVNVTKLRPTVKFLLDTIRRIKEEL